MQVTATAGAALDTCGAWNGKHDRQSSIKWVHLLDAARRLRTCQDVESQMEGAIIAFSFHERTLQRYLAT